MARTALSRTDEPRKPLKLAYVAIALAIVAALLVLIFANSGIVSYRYRLTVVVQTPEGIRTGNSVIEISTRRQFNPLAMRNCGQESSMPIEVAIRGQAAIVPLGRAGTIFAALTDRGGLGAEWYPAAAWRDSILSQDQLCPDWSSERRRAAVYRRQTEPGILFDATVSPGRRGTITPMFLRFGSPNDPRSVEILDPEHLENDLGPGYRVLRMTVAMTDDPITDDIVAKLPWLANHAGSLEPYIMPAGFHDHYRDRILATSDLRRTD